MKLQPPSSLLAGPSGSGKTSALATQLLCDLDVFVIITEPGGVESLLDSAERLKAPIDRLHWATCLPASAGWDALEDMISKINSMDQKGLADLRDLGKSSFRPAAMKLLNTFKNFTCERTGVAFGDVTQWDDTKSLNMDSLSGWTQIAWGATVGYKPTANPGEWGIGQKFIENMLLKLNNDRSCFFNMTAHVEKEMDDMTGTRRITVSTIGAKLAPRIPPFFSEFIRCSRTMDNKGTAEFTWSTLASDMELKNRALSISSKLPADFKPIIEAYRRRKTLAGATPSPAPQSMVVPLAVRPMVAPMRPAPVTEDVKTLKT
jgi:hypothetical protein